MLTIITRRVKRRKSSFANSYQEDSSWGLVDRMTAKSKIKKLSIEELVEKTKKDYAEMEETEYELDDEEEQ